MRTFLGMAANQAVDHEAIQVQGIPGARLMAAAGEAVVEAAEVAGLLNDPDDQQILLLAGKGNNGGDAFVVAGLLHDRGYGVKVLAIPAADQIKGDALHHFKRAVEAGVPMIHWREDLDPHPLFAEASLIFDGLLGTGISGDIRPPYDILIPLVNDAGVPVVAIDVPSGVSGDTGEILIPCIQAELTVSMGFGKLGTLFDPARSRAGRVVVADIGFPENVLERIDAVPTYEVFPGDFSLHLLARPRDAHKYQVGKVLIVAGAPGFSGAAILAARAAGRSGAGLVRLAVPETIAPIAETASLETVVEACPQTSSGGFSLAAEDRLRELADWADVVAWGPGLGRQSETLDLTRRLLTDIQAPLVLDADGLYALHGHLELLHDRPAPTLLTPHLGEFRTVLGMDSKEPVTWETATQFAADHQVMLLLKGAPSLIATPDGRFYVNSTGHAGLATGGSGDVLTGILAGLWSQCDTLPDILNLAMVKHGECADLLRDIKGILGLLAGDLVETLPEVLKDFGA